MLDCMIKVREVGKKRWVFLSREGVNHLRIHALRFTREQAERLIAENEADNPEWEWKIVENTLAFKD